jgi:hypothetical protein
MSFVGIQINKHYSHGKLYSIAVFHDAKNCCSEMSNCDEMDEPKTCNHRKQPDCTCSNESEVLKISDVFIGSRFTIPITITLDVSISRVNDISSSLLIFVIANTNTLYNLPPPSDIDFQSEFSVFLC